MPNNEYNPQPEHIDIVDVPHSGDRRLPEELREIPHVEYDNTSLPEAQQLGYLTTPESPASLLEKPSKKKMSRAKKLGLWLVGGGIAGTAAIIPLVAAMENDTNAIGTDTTNSSTNPGGSGEVAGGGIEGGSTIILSDSEIRRIEDLSLLSIDYPDYATILKNLDSDTVNAIKEVLDSTIPGDRDSEIQASGAIRGILASAGAI